METSNSAYEDDAEFAGLPPLVEKPEGDVFEYSSLIQGGSQRFLHLTYGLGVRSSFELYDDDEYGLIKQAPKALAQSANFVIEQAAANVFNLGFTTVKSIDGVSLFNTQHPLLGGPGATAIGPGLANVIYAAGTFPNRPSPDMDPSITALQLAINQFERSVNANGLPIALKPKHILCPPEQKWIWREILGSPHKPYVADNEINAILGEDLNYFVMHYLTSQKSWFLVTDKESHQLKFYWRKKLDQDFSDDFDTKSLKETAHMRFSCGPTSYMGTWGSLGS
jgi:hypothetical protein